jgi:hypothetical protein
LNLERDGLWPGCLIAVIDMSPYAKAVLAALRLLALGGALVSLGLYANDLYLCLSHQPAADGSFALALKSLPFLAGAVLFWKSRAWAEHFTKDLD